LIPSIPDGGVMAAPVRLDNRRRVARGSSAMAASTYPFSGFIGVAAQ
jgi:hypothetical protein